MKKTIILFWLLLTLISCNENTTTNNIDKIETKKEISNNISIEKMESSNLWWWNWTPEKEESGR